MDSLDHALNKVANLVGKDNVVQDQETLIFYSTDVFSSANELSVAIISPGNADELIKVCQICIQNDVPLIVRGGGASYTSGYLPVVMNTVMIDTQRLKKIEINAEDMFVTVEPGVTWMELYEALKPLGLRTPFWGPFSGRVSTIGGSMSYHAISHGTKNSVSADSLAGMQVVIGNGDVIETGSKGKSQATSPFYRYYGPDLGGLFLGDSGALGINTKITLKLTTFPKGFSA